MLQNRLTALASHQCGPGSQSRHRCCMWVGFVVFKGAMSHTAHVREEALHLENVRQLFQVLRVIQYQEFIVFYLSHPLTVRIVRRSLVFHSPLRRFLCVFVSITLINGLFEVFSFAPRVFFSGYPGFRLS